jgi:hypothetical protein
VRAASRCGPVGYVVAAISRGSAASPCGEHPDLIGVDPAGTFIGYVVAAAG